MITSLNFSNQIETLVSHFAHKTASVLGDTVSPVVLVPNPYVEKWLQIQLTRINGISFNTRFYLFNRGLYHIASLLDRNNPARKTKVLEQEDLNLFVNHVLRQDIKYAAELQAVLSYLYDGHDFKDDFEIRLYQISERIARYLSEYELYRMDMIERWLNGSLLTESGMEFAQRYIYLSLFGKGGICSSTGRMTLPQYMKSVLFRTTAGKIDTVDLPRLFIVGESQLSPFHIMILYELGKYFEIHVYQVNPCSEFWEDITTPREDRWEKIRNVKVTSGDGGDVLQENSHENHLLKTWGKAGRENIKLLSMLEESGSQELHLFSDWLESEPLPGESVLQILQDQILHRMSVVREPVPQDRSVQVFECPDIFREVETVYNSICVNLDLNEGINMTDIGVMVPDMNRYGPVIQSVFSQRPERFSYSIIDFNASTESLFADALLGILECARESMTRKEIFQLLRNRCFLNSHNLTAEDAEVWTDWISSLNMYRQEFVTVEEMGEWVYYTFQFALRRHRLGRIMEVQEENEQSDYQGIIPYTDGHSSDLERINKFNTVLELLYYRLKSISSTEYSLREWIDIIKKLTADFIKVAEDDPEELYVQNACFKSLLRLINLQFLREQEGSGEEVYPLEFIYTYLRETISTLHGNKGDYLVTGVNISSLVPKRQIPFKIVYIMGMSEGDFPGTSDMSSLDIRNIKRRIGDTSTVEINQYLFLEILLGVREKLYISYVSRELEKDRTYIPSSIIGQLTSYIGSQIVNDEFTIKMVPLASDDDRYLLQSEVTSWSDILHTEHNGSVKLVNYWNRSRYNLFKKAVDQSSLTHASFDLTQFENHGKREYILNEQAKGSVEKSNRELTDIRALKRFIMNPAEAYLIYHLNVKDDYYTADVQFDEEPFYSPFPFSHNMAINFLDTVFCRGDQSEYSSMVKDLYERGKKAGLTPVDAYASIEMESYSELLFERIHKKDSETSFHDLIERRNRGEFYTDVIFGDYSSENSSIQFDPVVFECDADGTISVSLSGICRYLWLNMDGSAETLVITNSKDLKKRNIIDPFLFYISAVSGYNSELEQMVGSKPFKVHVSHKKGISSYEYNISREDARAYLDHLASDFYDKTQCDILPFEIISGLDDLKKSFNLKDSPSIHDKEYFKQKIITGIQDDNQWSPSYRPMRILNILDSSVPGDAYEKVYRRYKMMLEPVVER